MTRRELVAVVTALGLALTVWGFWLQNRDAVRNAAKRLT